MEFFRNRHRFAFACVALTLALTSCADQDFLEPVEPIVPVGHHLFPERVSSPGRSSHPIHGIDISRYQGNIDWRAVKQSGIEFAFIKSTEGIDWRDPKFAQNWAAAKAAGIPRGAYHFGYWCRPFSEQFEWFRRVVPRDKDALPPVLDLEWNSHSRTCPRKVSRERAKLEIRNFVRRAEAWYGKRPILYKDIRFFRDVLSDGSFAQYPLWVRSTKRGPQHIYEGRKWVFWQYSDRLRIPGIRGRVDKNAFAGSRRDWSRLVAANFNKTSVVAPIVVPAADPAPEPEKKPGPKIVETPQKDKAGAPTADEKLKTPVAAKANPDSNSRPPKREAAKPQAVQTTGAKPEQAAAAKSAVPQAAGKPLSLAPLNLRPKPAAGTGSKAVAR